MSKSLSKEKQKVMILNENMWKVMWRVSWPAILAMVLYGLNTVFDAIFVGNYVGETALAGVSLAYPLSQMTLGIGSLIGVGAGSALSIALGAGDKATQGRILGNVNYLSLISSVIFGVAAYIFAEPLVRFMGGEGEALALGTEYFRVTVIGSLFWVHGLACNMVVRAEGKMKSAAIMMGVGLGINILANYILVGLLHMGVAGAAWGTNLGMLIYTLVGLAYFKRGKASFEAHPFKLYRDKEDRQIDYVDGDVVAHHVRNVAGAGCCGVQCAVRRRYHIGYCVLRCRIPNIYTDADAAVRADACAAAGRRYQLWREADEPCDQKRQGIHIERGDIDAAVLVAANTLSTGTALIHAPEYNV